MTEPATLLCDAGAMIGETPVAAGGRILWTDPVNRTLLGWCESIGLSRGPLDASLWSLAALPDGPLVGSLDDRFCRVDAGVIVPSPAATIAPGCRFNDMAVDLAGGLWVGAMHRGVLATRGMIYRAASLESAPIAVATGLGVPNGMKVAADGATLWVVDTLARTLLAYPIDGNRLGEPVIVSDFMNMPGKPDGMAIAADGSFHVAMWGGGCVAHLAPDGATLGWSDLPAPHVSSVCADGERLLVTTSRMRLSQAALAEFPMSGGLFAIPWKSA